MELTLPYPPSINHYWRTRVVTPNGKRPFATTYISGDGKRFQQAVINRCAHRLKRIDGAVAISVDVFPPDRRCRDIDNVLKPLLDALTAAGAWRDDSQVESLSMYRNQVVRGGKVVVSIVEIPGCQNRSG